MNDVVTPVQPEGFHAAAQPVALSAGTMLRNAREAAGLHVAALAVSMKVPVKKLEALEADRLDLLPDAVFVRALASSVCRTLKIDPAPVLQKLPQTSVPRLDTEERGINEPFHSPGQSASLSVPAFFAKPAVLAVLALMLGVALVAFLPEGQKSEHASEPASVPPPAAMPQVLAPAEEPALPATVAVAVEPPAAPKPEAVVAAPAVATPAPAPAAPASPKPEAAKVVAPMPALAPAAPAVKVETAPSTPVNAAAAAPTTGVVVFKVRGPSWVEVTDGKGVVQLRKTLAAGETIGASGALPLAVVVGRADVTDVEVRGKAFDLASIVKDNVARFEVK